jgi:hypothetical protein
MKDIVNYWEEEWRKITDTSELLKPSYYSPLMKKSLPDFSDLEKNYPSTEKAEEVIRDINPEYENLPGYENTCAMRVSKALNYCKGHEIPQQKGLLCIIGKDKKRYAIRVREMERYIKDTYGEPVFELKAEKGIIDNSSIIGKKGIISFHVSGWGDATGHISLWNGKKVLYTGNRNYFNLYYKTSSNKFVQVIKCYLWV